MTVDEDAARGHVEEARNEVDQRGFARAAGADKRQHFAGVHLEIDVMQNLMLAFFGASRRSPHSQTGRIVEAMQASRRGPFLHVVLGIEEGEDGRRCAHGLLEAVVEVGELAHRIVELEEQDDEGAEEAHGHAAVQNLIAADEQEHGDGDGADGIHQWRTDGLNAHAAQVGAEEAA